MPLLENLLNAALEGEINAHMNDEERSSRRNGYNCVSADTISAITDKILPELQSWRIRPLDQVYL